MSNYPFQLLPRVLAGSDNDKSWLLQRPLSSLAASFAENAGHFIAEPGLLDSINAAIALGVPLLLTGEAGSGKTQVAYYVAHQLGLEPVLHVQAKSTSTAKDLLYDFDAVRYFQDAQVNALQAKAEFKPLNKASYLEPRPLWQAMAAKEPRVLLIDDIDQAPRDFPGDLLHELDKLEFTIPELSKTYSTPLQKRPLVFITSHGERPLPEPFLRRCLFHSLRFDAALAAQIVAQRAADYAGLSPVFIEQALARFFSLREQDLRKKPGLSELLMWLRVLALAGETAPLPQALSQLPYLSALLKESEDFLQLSQA